MSGASPPPVPLSDGLDTRPCQILDPPLFSVQERLTNSVTNVFCDSLPKKRKLHPSSVIKVRVFYELSHFNII